MAPAKINLDLLITGRREDGYHLLDSLVVFTEFGDELYIEKSDSLSLDITGPFSNGLTVNEDNLVLRAAKLIAEEAKIQPNFKFHLVKNLPVSSGIGGGSSDAAAAIKLIIELFNLEISDERLNEIGLKLGADIPVCLLGQTSHMSGIGEKLVPFDIKDDLYLLLVNPSISVSTPEIFKEYKIENHEFDKERHFSKNEVHLPFILDALNNSHNSLQSAAVSKKSVIQDVISAIDTTEGLLLSRMSGSGATCFGIYSSEKDCHNAYELIIKEKNNWWVKSTKVI
nr:4-(cytidine 5'-diphospho)-2-C-methyl-D-erythritol kinase [Pseudemcibacter aquimaris]